MSSSVAERRRAVMLNTPNALSSSCPNRSPGRRAQHGKLVIQRRRQPVERVVAVIGALDRGRQQSHDVRVPGGDPEHAGAAGADQQAWAGPALGQHVEVQAVDLVPGARVIHRPPASNPR